MIDRIKKSMMLFNAPIQRVYLGDWINSRNLQNDVVVLGKGAHTPDCKPELIKPQIEESLERLKISKIDIYCLHRDNNEIPVSESFLSTQPISILSDRLHPLLD